MPVRRRIAAGIASLAMTTSAFIGLAAPSAQAWPTANFRLIGHGEGDGIGMSQDGAVGYATRYGWNYRQILTHYYGGSVRTVGLAPMTVDMEPRGATHLRVTSSGAAFQIDTVTVPAGGSAMLSYSAAAGYQVQVASRCSATYGPARPVRSNTFRSTVGAPSSAFQMLHICGVADGYPGTLSLVPHRLSPFSMPYRVVNTLPMDAYLRSVVSYLSSRAQDLDPGKHDAWLQAQAIAARSLTASSHQFPWAKVTAQNETDLFYQGAGDPTHTVTDARSDEAIRSTSSQVVLNPAGTAVAHTVWVASSGGWTAGGGFPAVEDAGDVVAPRHTWRTAIPLDNLQEDLGLHIGTLRQVSFTRNGLGDLGGRVRTVTLRGDRGSVTVTGAYFRLYVGLLSDWFAVDYSPPSIHLSNTFPDPVVSYEGALGQVGDRPLACDFDGDGKDTVGVYRAATGTFYLRNTLTAGPTYAVRLGTAGDLPVCGDWNGDGVDTVGVYDPRAARFYLINSVTRSASTPVIQVQLGGRGFQPVAGDWNGDHRATVGAFDPVHQQLYLVDSLAPGAARRRYQLESWATSVFTGDFIGQGRDGYAAYDGNGNIREYYSADNTDGIQDYWPYTAGIPLAGDWDGDGDDTVGYGSNY